ncbi:potassium channel family protein [Luteitalea sp. TBR-22]|uniref:potassium channel family protein n=1 Tax=Luteitalea sp. TBR-22 TaxID=2802971 RepID=UPI001EF71DEA|nr:potassium channel family protein [Luteitalea sp. TBR-22]
MPGPVLPPRAADAELHALLVTLVLALFVGPPLTQAGLVGPWLVQVLFAAIVAAGALAVAHRSRPVLRVAMAAFVAVTMLARWQRDAVGTPGWQLADAVCSALAIALFAGVILRRVFSDGPITLGRIEGAVAVYLLVGVLWALLYEGILLRDPGALAVATGRPVTESDLSYYSFVTLTTVGYGDVTPVAPVARSLAVMEALIGQLYPAVLIARLVSLEIAHRPPRT